MAALCRYLAGRGPGRDTVLGRSEAGQLIIIRPPTPATSVQNGVLSIGLISLPDELLVVILELATHELRHHGRFGGGHLNHADKYRDAVALLAVCRRFRRIITPFFYRTLSISFGRNSVWSQDYIRKPRAIKHLVSSLRNNPTLG